MYRMQRNWTACIQKGRCHIWWVGILYIIRIGFALHFYALKNDQKAIFLTEFNFVHFFSIAFHQVAASRWFFTIYLNIKYCTVKKMWKKQFCVWNFCVVDIWSIELSMSCPERGWSRAPILAVLVSPHWPIHVVTCCLQL
jgi:hypothetical protein